MHKIISGTILVLVSTAILCMASEIKTEDKNNDTKPDMWIYYDDTNRPVKIESDRNYDGNIDLWIIYGGKGARTTQIDMNFDGRPDMYSYYQYGQRMKLEIDLDYDGKLDQVTEYRDGRVSKMQRANKKGQLETVFDTANRYSSQEKHTEYYENNPKPLEESQTLPKKQKAKQK